MIRMADAELISKFKTLAQLNDKADILVRDGYR